MRRMRSPCCARAASGHISAVAADKTYEIATLHSIKLWSDAAKQ